MSESETSSANSAAEMAVTVMQLINMAAFFASPRVVAAAREMPPREHILEHIDRFLSLLTIDEANPAGPGSQSLMDTRPHALALRDLLAEWTAEPVHSPLVVPPTIQGRARALLHAHSIPEPSCGWDHFEAPKNDEEPTAEDADPLAGTVFPGKNLSIYLEALRIGLGEGFWERLADVVDRLTPAEGSFAAASPAQLRMGGAMDWLFECGMKVAQALDLLSAFLSPHAASKAKRIPTHEEVLEHLSAYFEYAERLRLNPQCEVSRRIVATEPRATKLRDIFRQWIPTRYVPAEVTQCVRSLFEGIGIREPPEGWDRFEGFAVRQR